MYSKQSKETRFCEIVNQDGTKELRLKPQFNPPSTARSDAILNSMPMSRKDTPTNKELYPNYFAFLEANPKV